MAQHVATRTLGDAVYAILDGIDGMTAYRGQVGIRPGTPEVVKPPTLPDTNDGRVAPYCVLYTAPGMDTPMDLGGQYRSLDWTFQVTYAAGWAPHLESAVDAGQAALLGRQDFPGLITSDLRQDFDPGPFRLDGETTPPRYYLPIFYRLTATTGATA